MGDNPNITNSDTRPSITQRKNLVWIRDPQGKPSSFLCEVTFVDVITFRRNSRLILIITCGINLVRFNLFCSSTCLHVVDFYLRLIIRI